VKVLSSILLHESIYERNQVTLNIYWTNLFRMECLPHSSAIQVTIKENIEIDKVFTTKKKV
jgi:hypothetical protein